MQTQGYGLVNETNKTCLSALGPPRGDSETLFKYHSTSPEEMTDFLTKALGPDASWQDIGDWLHVLQDSYSHQRGKKTNLSYRTESPGSRLAWHEVPLYGGTWKANPFKPDYTWWRPELADKMAEKVYKEGLLRLASQRGLAPRKNWDDIMAKVKDFNRYKHSGWRFWRTLEKKKRILWEDLVSW